MQKIKSENFFVVLAIALFGCLLWGWCVNFELTIDDHFHITQNPIFINKSGILEILATPTWPGNLYRPVTTISIYLENLISPGSPKLMHAVNVALHIAASILVYFTARSFFPLFVAALASLLFLANPIHQEVVANISTRNESISAILILSAILLAIRGSLSLFKIAAINLLYILAIFTKESSFVALALIGVFFWVKSRNIKTSLLLGSSLLLTAITAFCLRTSVVGLPQNTRIYTSALDNIFLDSSFIQRLPYALSLMGNYLQDTVFPVLIFQDYTFPMVDFCSPAGCGVGFYLSIFIVVLFAAVVVAGYKYNPAVFAFGSLTFIAGALSNNLLIISINHYALRYMYLPSAGVLVLLACLINKIPAVKVKFFVAILLLGYYFQYTFRDLGKWKNDMDLRIEEIINGNYSYKSYLSFSIGALSKNRLDIALEYALKADKTYPNLEPTLNLLSKIYIQTGDLEKAKAILIRISREVPDSTVACDGLGWIYLYQGDLAQSKGEFDKCLRISPALPSSLIGVMNLLVLEKRFDEAETMMKGIPEAARKDPRFIEAEKMLRSRA